MCGFLNKNFLLITYNIIFQTFFYLELLFFICLIISLMLKHELISKYNYMGI